MHFVVASSVTDVDIPNLQQRQTRDLELWELTFLERNMCSGSSLCICVVWYGWFMQIVREIQKAARCVSGVFIVAAPRKSRVEKIKLRCCVRSQERQAFLKLLHHESRNFRNAKFAVLRDSRWFRNRSLNEIPKTIKFRSSG